MSATTSASRSAASTRSSSSTQSTTQDLTTRLRAYPPNATVLATHHGTPKTERAIHGQFRFALERGREWFRPHAELEAHIAKVIAEHGAPDRALNDRHRQATPRPIVAGKRATRRA